MTAHECKIPYEVIRSNRGSVALEIRPDLSVVVRAPSRMSQRQIEEFVSSRQQWLEDHMKIMEQRRRERAGAPPITMEEVRRLADQAMTDLPPRIRRYAALMGVTYNKVTIRNQRSRWGSCSSKGNLNFNCLLMLVPEEVRDYVVVHELAHRRQMNHSPRFWAEVEKVMPDYRRRRDWLMKNGGQFIERMVE